MTDKRIEERIGLDSPEAFEIKTSGPSVTGIHLYADGSDGQEKEVNLTDPVAGASSTAPASSGIPSAMTQRRIADGVSAENPSDHAETSMENRDIPTRQNLQP